MSAAQGLDRVHVLMSDSPGSTPFTWEVIRPFKASVHKMGLPIVVAPTQVWDLLLFHTVTPT